MAEKPTSKPFVANDSATMAHVREMLERGPDLKRVEAELRARGLIPPPKTPPIPPRKP
jgi:hypothetical protein